MASTINLAYEEVIDFIASGLTPQDVIAFQPSPAAKARVAELIRREKTGDLASDEKAELDHYLEIEHIMRLAKARARKHLADEQLH